jgi:hypothetical protein
MNLMHIVASNLSEKLTDIEVMAMIQECDADGSGEMDCEAPPQQTAMLLSFFPDPSTLVHKPQP